MQRVIGRTTESQMQIGIYWGYVAMIEGLVARHEARDRPPGEGHRHRRPRHPVRQAHRLFDAIEPDLTIQGLSLLYGMAIARLEMIPGEELLFLALGGSGEIGMNVNLYGCRGQWIMVDLGLTFADPDYPGIDLILPDLEFIEDAAGAARRHRPDPRP